MTEQQEFNQFQEIPYQERLIAPIEPDRLPLGEFRMVLAPVALLGAVRRCGLTFRITEQLDLELENVSENPENEDEISYVRVASFGGWLGTGGKKPKSISEVIYGTIVGEPIPLARTIHFQVDDSAITIYTLNIENENPVLEFELMSTNTEQRLNLTIGREEPTYIAISSNKFLNPYVNFTERYDTIFDEDDENRIAIFRVSRTISLANPVVSASKRLWNDIERLKELAAENAPSPLIEDCQNNLLVRIYYILSALLDTEPSKEKIEKIDQLAQRFLIDPTEKIIQEVFNEARESVPPTVLGLLKARVTTGSISPPTEWSVAASFHIGDEGLTLKDVKGEGISSRVFSRWKEEAERFTQQEEMSREFFSDLANTKHILYYDFENFMAISAPGIT